MAIPLKDLLAGAVKRAQIAKPLQGARIVEAANQYLHEVLPPSRNNDARTIFYRDKLLMVACLNSAVASFVNQRSEDMLTALKRRLPDCQVDRIQTKIVSEFPQRDFVVK